MTYEYTHTHSVCSIFLKAPSSHQATLHADCGRFFLLSSSKLCLNEVPLHVLIGSQSFPLKPSHVISDRKLCPS